MKLLLLHGPATQASRKKLTDLKAGFDPNNVIVFEKGSDLQTILGSLATPTLFSDPGLVILENPPEDYTNFTLSPCPFTLILWFDHEVDYKKWQGFVSYFFPEGKEVTAFPFLDALVAKDKKAFLEADKLMKEGFDIFYMITMVYYLLRTLINPPENVPQFVKAKLQRQIKEIPLQSAVKLYKAVLDIDFNLKKGFLEKSHAQLLLVNLFLSLQT